MREYPSYPILCGIGAFLCLVPLPWHWQARNVSTLIYLGWVSTACVFACVNSTLWAGNIDDKAPAWCDISTRFSVCLNTGITTSGLIIQRRLYRVATIQEVSITEDSRKRELIINLLIGVGLPLMMMPLYYVVQSLRYVIIEDFGCWPATSPTFMTILMFSLWPVLVSTASFIYAMLTIRAFFKSRQQFSKYLFESGANLSVSRFFRLMALAATDMVFALPLSLYFLISGPLDTEYYPYSWADVHEYIHEVGVVTREDMDSDLNYKVGMGFSRWVIPGGAFLFFIYFGLSAEAMRQYKLIFWRAVAPLGFKPPVTKPKTQKVSWIRRRTTGATTTCQDLIVPPPAYETQSKAEQVEGLDEKMDISGIDVPSGANVNDLESQVSGIEEVRERDAQNHDLAK